MHPFCCVSAVSDNSSPAPFAAPALAMPPLPARSDSAPRHAQLHLCLSNGGESGRASLPPAPGAVDVRINDLFGNGISGILHKWVNYGKGWRPRWFVLQDGVLSYYKIHGPDKIVVNSETEKGSKVIGEESARMISRNRNSNRAVNHRRKPVGEIHLKISTIRESRSDDKRFSVFTGTKRLHLRADTREDRVAWMEALQAVKDMFPRISNSELMAPVDNVAVSTEKLRHRLMEEGVSESAIQDTEKIMRNEYAALQNQLQLLKQKQVTLIDTLRQLEVHLMKSRKLHASQTGYSWWISTTAKKAGHS